MVTSPLFWLRLPMLLVMSIRVGLSYSERAKERVWHSRTIFYGANVAWITFAMTLGIVFAPILPIIALMALLWLLIISVLWKWDLVFVFTQQVSGGGRVRCSTHITHNNYYYLQMWRHIFWHMITAMLSQQIFVAAIVGLKGCYAGSIMMIAPFIATWIFAATVERRFAKATVRC